MSHKRLLYDKQPLKTLPRHFGYFDCPIFKMTFNKNVMKKAAILCWKGLPSDNRWQ